MSFTLLHCNRVLGHLRVVNYILLVREILALVESVDERVGLMILALKYCNGYIFLMVDIRNVVAVLTNNTV